MSLFVIWTQSPGFWLNECTYDNRFQRLHKVEIFLCCSLSLHLAEDRKWFMSFIWGQLIPHHDQSHFPCRAAREELTTWLCFTSKFDIISYSVWSLNRYTKPHSLSCFPWADIYKGRQSAQSWRLKREKMFLKQDFPSLWAFKMT